MDSVGSLEPFNEAFHEGNGTQWGGPHLWKNPNASKLTFSGKSRHNTENIITNTTDALIIVNHILNLRVGSVPIRVLS